jgi:hypothetical protein
VVVAAGVAVLPVDWLSAAAVGIARTLVVAATTIAIFLGFISCTP